jgi:hypothetical protein
MKLSRAALGGHVRFGPIAGVRGYVRSVSPGDPKSVPEISGNAPVHERGLLMPSRQEINRPFQASTEVKAIFLTDGDRSGR